MKSTPKKRKVLRHGATSFTGNFRRRRGRSQDHVDTGGVNEPTRRASRDQAAGSSAKPTAEPPDEQRLQKVLAAAGVGSRRECEELILSGRVEIDGQTVTQLGVRVDSRRQKVAVDGEVVRFERRTYYAVNKPTGVLSTNRDPAGRIRVVDLVGGDQRLFTVGRLDQHSEGLIIVTNDGELTQRLTHPRYGVPKRYLVQVAGEATGEVVGKLLAGVRLEEGIAKAANVFIRKRHKHHTVLEMVLTEGRNREIRRMLAQLGHKVQRLTRIAVGPVRLGNLKPGQFRPLESWEVRALKDLAFEPAGAATEPASQGERPRGKREFPKRRQEHDAPATPRSDERRARGGARPAKPPRQGRPGKFVRPETKPRKWSSGGDVPAATERPSKERHPLPFLKQRLVVEENEPTTRTPLPAKRGSRRKPLRRLRQRRREET